MHAYSDEVGNFHSALTLSQFKDLCPPMLLWNIGRKISSICRFPDHITHSEVCELSQEVGLPVPYIQFAIDLLLLGMSDVLGLHRQSLYGGAPNFSCFCDPASRIEMASYFASQMIAFRNELRCKFQYVDILLTSALKAPFTYRVITSFNGFEKSKNIILFCGLSVHTLLMACDPRTISGSEHEQKKIYMAQLEWRMRHTDADELLFLRRGHTPRGEGRDVWDRSGPDSMENITQLLLAAATVTTVANNAPHDGLLLE